MPTLCGPDKLQKKSIAHSVPKAEGAGCPFAYFSDKGKVRLADVSRVEMLLILKRDQAYQSLAINPALASTLGAGLRLGRRFRRRGVGWSPSL